MRCVALDLGAREISFCEVAQGKVILRRTVRSLDALSDVLGPGSSPAKVAIEACREAWFVHDKRCEWGHEVLLVDTTRSRQLRVLFVPKATADYRALVVGDRGARIPARYRGRHRQVRSWAGASRDAQQWLTSAQVCRSPSAKCMEGLTVVN